MTFSKWLMGIVLAGLPQESHGFASCVASASRISSSQQPLRRHWQTSMRRANCGSNKQAFHVLVDAIQMSSEAKEDENQIMETEPQKKSPEEKPLTTFQSLQKFFPPSVARPPIQVDDQDLLFYDVFLLINLSVSISFWVVHRLQLGYLGVAFNEGCLLAMCWIAAGLWNGVFLYSAVDGHHLSSDEKAGPKAAGLLALNTFVGTINLRLLFALLVAVFQHRHVGGADGELIMPLELGFGLILMSAWRALHSSMVPRL